MEIKYVKKTIAWLATLMVVLLIVTGMGVWQSLHKPLTIPLVILLIAHIALAIKYK
ncbi:MAG: hypothetical protein ABIB71_05595 [Candidatus Woesearchaeota archaeon]